MMMMLLFLISIIMISHLNDAKLTEVIFYQSDPLIYTPEFCKSITNRDFIESIIRSEPKKETETDKPKAFKTLFDSCKDWFLYDAAMAKNIIVPIVDTDNSEYLPILLDRSEKMTENFVKLNNLDMTSEILSIVLHLFTVNISPNLPEYFFQTRHPETALAHLLTYTTVTKAALGDGREALEAFNNHAMPGQYSDSNSVEKAIRIVDEYLAHPETIGNHKPQVFLVEVGNKSKKFTQPKGGHWITTVGIILGMASILAIVLGLLWKSDYKFIN